jgi:hypothetical protein
MRRKAAVTGVCVLVVAGAVATAVLAADVQASASASTSISASASPKTPARIVPVKHGSVWTLMAGVFCERDAFATGRAFTALDPDNGDRGRYRGTRTVTLTWKAGVSVGAVFTGTFSRANGYTGTFATAAQTVAAYLVPSSTFGCVTVTTAPRSASVAPGVSDTDTATVTGDGGVTPAGTVHFYVCPGDAGPCSPTALSVVDLGTVSLTPSGSGPDATATATSPPFSSPTDGTYCFDGVYSGDPHYPTVGDGSTSDECFTVASVP